MAPPVRPRTFFLNEQHEFSRGEKAGGGRIAKYAPSIGVRRVEAALRTRPTRRTIQQSTDPLRKRRYLLIATPEPAVKKESSDKKKAPTGTFEEPTNYKGEHSKVFRRLGMDLLEVNDQGVATVHATAQRSNDSWRQPVHLAAQELPSKRAGQQSELSIQSPKRTA